MLGMFKGLDNNNNTNNLNEKIDLLKKKWNDTGNTAKSVQLKNKELYEFSDIVSKGYITNLNIIVDISKLLLEHKKFMEELSKSLEELNSDITNFNVNPDEIKKLTGITSYNIDKITNFFSKDLAEIKDLFSRKNDTSSLANISTIESTFNNINTMNRNQS
jgi:hypothetical protein